MSAHSPNGRTSPCWWDPAGSCRQRNAILRHRPDDSDIVIFFDDDFLPHPGWIAAACRFFAENPDVGAITGDVIADGIKGPGIPFDEARATLAAAGPADAEAVVENFPPYGCNMAFRATAVRDIRFDERLVLYGWLEDLDFGGALARNGWRTVKIGAARGVHMGIKQGRIAGRKLGYSQIMNPVYIRRKGGLDTAGMVRQILRNVGANLARSVAPEAYVDRRGRVLGNLLALADLCRGRITPERAERL